MPMQPARLPLADSAIGAALLLVVKLLTRIYPAGDVGNGATFESV
jgi:hypothetical protein